MSRRSWTSGGVPPTRGASEPPRPVEGLGASSPGDPAAQLVKRTHDTTTNGSQSVQKGQHLRVGRVSSVSSAPMSVPIATSTRPAGSRMTRCWRDAAPRVGRLHRLRTPARAPGVVARPTARSGAGLHQHVLAGCGSRTPTGCRCRPGRPVEGAGEIRLRELDKEALRKCAQARSSSARSGPRSASTCRWRSTPAFRHVHAVRQQRPRGAGEDVHAAPARGRKTVEKGECSSPAPELISSVGLEAAHRASIQMVA
jgi:hypothetical protein